MTRDQLDDLLDASAPAARAIDPNHLHTMVVEARAESSTPKRRRRVAILTGTLALLLAGGAGVATAAGDWLWGDGLENPDRSYTYTSPTWGQCEIRFSGLETHNMFTQADVNTIVDEWFATTDVEAAAAPFVDKHLAVVEESQEAAPEVQNDPRAADLNAWTAHEQALGEALYNELREQGFDSDRLAGSESHSQVHCDGEDWGGEGGAP
ncbi:hypothetical protein [Microbacterium sp. EST19A]|uniref:hypothetical protein n=1 Tax=Microbacterium sp. EST19A TaxID=2862681 RepID=UPI001CBF12F5|nr:hypothetical protein [Microbacterium sp. EST19A]